MWRGDLDNNIMYFYRKYFAMKQVTIVVPKGKTNLACITGAFNILNSANTYWQKQGHKPGIEISIAGLMKELKLDAGYLSVHPVNINDITITDLVLIPAVSYDDNLIKENA